MSIDTSELFLPLLCFMGGSRWHVLISRCLQFPFVPAATRCAVRLLLLTLRECEFSFRRSVTVDAAAENRLTIVLCLGVTSPRFSVFEAFSARGDGAISFPLVAFVSVFSCSFFWLSFHFILSLSFVPLWLKLIWSFESSCFFLSPSYPSFRSNTLRWNIPSTTTTTLRD